MNVKSKTTISIIIVILIIVLVVGATFSYWMWASNAEQKTNLNFTFNGNVSNTIYANLNGNGTITTSALVPTTCTSKDAIKKEISITYANGSTNVNAKIDASLIVNSFISEVSIPNSTQLSYLKWAITTSDTSCVSNINSSGTFSSLSTGITPQTLTSIKIDVPSNTTETTAVYYLYIWLDSTYEYTNKGSINSDPMQNLNFTLQWSGTIEQVE